MRSDSVQPHSLLKLEKVQNQAARFIASDNSQEPGSMTVILEQLKLEPLKQRRKKS